MNWQNLWEILGITAIIASASTYLIRKLVDKFFQNKTDEYRNNLELKLEEFRSKLSLEVTKASRLHDKRLLIIAELFEKLENLSQSMSELTSILKFSAGNYEKEEQDRAKNSTMAFNEFVKFYHQKRIFFSPSSNVLIDNLIQKYREAYIEYTNADLPGADKFPSLLKVDEIMKKIIPPIKESLEEEFRKEVGTFNL